MNILSESRISGFNLNEVIGDFAEYHAVDRASTCRAPLFLPNQLVLAHQLDSNTSAAKWEPLDPDSVILNLPMPDYASDPYLSANTDEARPWTMEEVAILGAVVEAKANLQHAAIQLGRTHREVTRFYYSHKYTDILRNCSTKQPPLENAIYPFPPPHRKLVTPEGEQTDIVACNWHAMRFSAPRRALPSLSSRIHAALWRARASRAVCLLEGISRAVTVGRRAGRQPVRPFLRPHIRITDDVDTHVSSVDEAAEVASCTPLSDRVDGGLRFCSALVERLLPPAAVPFFRVWLGAASCEGVGLTRAFALFITTIRPLLLPPGCGSGSGAAATAPAFATGCASDTPRGTCAHAPPPRPRPHLPTTPSAPWPPRAAGGAPDPAVPLLHSRGVVGGAVGSVDHTAAAAAAGASSAPRGAHADPYTEVACAEEDSAADAALRLQAEALQTRVARAARRIDGATRVRSTSPGVTVPQACDGLLASVCPLDVMLMRGGDAASSDDDEGQSVGGAASASRGRGAACPLSLTTSRYANITAVYAWDSVPAPPSAEPLDIGAYASVAALHAAVDGVIGSVGAAGGDISDMEDEALYVRVAAADPCIGWDARVVVATARLRAQRVDDDDDDDQVDGDDGDDAAAGDSSDG